MPVITREFTYTNSSGLAVRGCIYLPDEEKKHAALVFGHGFGSCMAELEHYKEVFTENGLALVLFDFCGGGNKSTSDGLTTEMSVLTEADDALCVLRNVKNEPGIDPENVFLGGESQGGYVAALLGARYKDESAGLVLWYPATGIGRHMKEMLEKGEPLMTEIFGVKVGKVYTDDVVTTDIYAEIKGYDKPVLILQGDKDRMIPVESSEELVRDYYTDAVLQIIKGSGHGFNGHASKKAANKTIAFINENIK